MAQLHLIRLEYTKLLTGKTFFVAVLAFLISIGSTFTALSFTPGFAESMTTQFSELSFLPPGDAADLAEAMQDLFQTAGSDLELSFPQSLYVTSNGMYFVMLVFTTVHVLADFSYGTVKNALLCGYSRRQYYVAKLVSSYLGGCLYLTISMVVYTVIGLLFYGTVLTPVLFSTLLLILFAQLVVAAQHTAIYTGFAFLFRNGWSFGASVLLLFLLPGVPAAHALLTGSDSSFLLSIVPTHISMSGVRQFITVDQMAALPSLWTAGYAASALMVAVVVICVMSALGLRSFTRQNL